MSVLVLDQVSLAYGLSVLLDRVSLVVEPGEKLCLVGKNGAGKSSLLKLITGENKPDSGQIRTPDQCQISYLEQQVPVETNMKVRTMVARGNEKLHDLMNAWHDLLDNDPENADEQARLMHEIETLDGWSFEQKIDSILERLGLDGSRDFSDLSGGWRRRVLLARALVTEPDILLLDEPTNHLDMESIVWLEQFLTDYKGTLVFISHDRFFIDRIATRIIELDRGHMASFPGTYQQYLVKKQELLENEEKQNKEFDKKLAQEEVWIRQGIKARRTRNEGRVRALKALRAERSQRRERQGNAGFSLSESERSGKRVMELKSLSFGYQGEKPLVDQFSTLIERGDKIALVGPNGVGKTTLIKLLLDQQKPDSGEIIAGTKLEIAYFDQTQEYLDPEATVLDTVAQGNDRIEIGERQLHIYSYMQEFLFSPERSRAKIKSLSGGERNRVMLARLFTKSFNFLVMDEPTNDLDLETLELLESQLVAYQGTLILVSHDRRFIDSVVTQCWIFKGNGRINEWFGGFSEWLDYNARQLIGDKQSQNQAKQVNSSSKGAGAISKPIVVRDRKKLSYKIQLEYDRLPEEIEQLEAEIEKLNKQLADPALFQSDSVASGELLVLLAESQKQLDAKVERWVELEELAGN